MPCEERGGDWSYAAISQGMLNIANYHWRHGTQQEIDPTNILIPYCCPPEL